MKETLLALFFRWADLEPERCCIRQSADPSEITIEVHNGKAFITVWSVQLSDIADIGLNELLASLLKAIVQRKWRVKLENSAQGWRAALAPSDSAIAWRPEPNPEPAIALLTAYLMAMEALLIPAPEGGIA